MSNNQKAVWTQPRAVELCRAVEAVSPEYGCHVALTGGLLYKEGVRKDCDLLFYRVRQVVQVNWTDFAAALKQQVGLTFRSDKPAWCVKADWNGLPVDCFFPEEGAWAGWSEHGGDY